MKLVWYDVSNKIIAADSTETDTYMLVPHDAVAVIVINSDEVPGEVTT
jgi:hypothetical protein